MTIIHACGRPRTWDGSWGSSVFRCSSPPAVGPCSAAGSCRTSRGGLIFYVTFQSASRIRVGMALPPESNRAHGLRSTRSVSSPAPPAAVALYVCGQPSITLGWGLVAGDQPAWSAAAVLLARSCCRSSVAVARHLADDAARPPARCWSPLRNGSPSMAGPPSDTIVMLVRRRRSRPSTSRSAIAATRKTLLQLRSSATPNLLVVHGPELHHRHSPLRRDALLAGSTPGGARIQPARDRTPLLPQGDHRGRRDAARRVSPPTAFGPRPVVATGDGLLAAAASCCPDPPDIVELAVVSALLLRGFCDGLLDDAVDGRSDGFAFPVISAQRLEHLNKPAVASVVDRHRCAGDRARRAVHDGDRSGIVRAVRRAVLTAASPAVTSAHHGGVLQHLKRAVLVASSRNGGQPSTTTRSPGWWRHFGQTYASDALRNLVRES